MAKANALIFNGEDALLVALTSGMVPGELQATPVRYAKSPQGVVAIVPEKRLPREVSRALGGAGVEVRAIDVPLAQASCWGEVLALAPVPESQVGMQLVLFLLEGDQPLIDLAGELLRLGCDRQAYAIQETPQGQRALLRAADPPYYTVAAALDRGSRIAAYVPVRPGQELVFAELGHTHPLRETVQAPPGEILLLPRGAPWMTLRNGPWTDIYQLIDFRLPEGRETKRAREPNQKLVVPLRFSRATRTESPSLWVIRNNAIEVIDRLVQSLPDDILSRLRFAVTGTEEAPIVVLRARMTKAGPPEIDLAAEDYVSLLRIPNLFVPRDRLVEPPLRRDKLRELLAPRDDELGWLAPTEDGQFRIESISDSAFRPLMDWVEYLVQAGASRLQPWVESALFDFEAYVSTGVEWEDKPKSPTKKEAPARRPRPEESRTAEEDEEDDFDFDEETDPTGNIPVEVSEEVLAPVEQDLLTPDEEQLEELEQRFLDLEDPLDAASRTSMWAQMARLNGRLNRHRDAGLCWAYALWEQTGETAAALAREWAEVDTGVKEPQAMVECLVTALSTSKPSRGDVRDVVSVLVASHLSGVPEPEMLPDLHEVQVWLDGYDELLDVRSLWLARHALSDLVGGDPLALARARDGILTRLRVGLSLERDVPNFLRFLGGGAGGGKSSEQLVERLEALLVTYSKTTRRRKPTEAPEALTGAYVRLVMAYGLARLGASDRARELRDEATQALDTSDPIHGFLVEAFCARIDQALEGRPAETPLPSEIAGQLNALKKFDRYKADRLREVSTILEPQENLDPIQAYQKDNKDPRGEEFARLRGMSDAEELGQEIDRLMDVAIAAPAEERDRLFDGLMDFFPLTPSRARRNLDLVVEHLDVIEPGRRALILQEALMLAGYFGLSSTVRELAANLEALLLELKPRQAVAVAGQFGKSLRSLRRVGLRDEAAKLLETMQNAIAGEGHEELVARVQVGGGLMYLGDLERARPAMASAFEFLGRSGLNMEHRLKVHQAAAFAWSQAPEQHAIANLQKLTVQLKQITDAYGTNSHFCRSVIQFMESLVLGYASEHLALGDLGRRWLDEDEYLIRRRIHRALGA